MHDGGKVVYAGQEQDGLLPGVHGRVLSCTALYGHVQWLEGPHKGDVGLYPVEDLAAVGRMPSGDPGRSVGASLNDSLEVGSLVSVASAKEAYDVMGGEGLVSHLASAGYLAAYASMAEDVLQQLVSGLSHDPVIRQVIAQMDPEEAEDVLRRSATLLLTSGDF
jgi:hypothetical protein